MPPRKAVVLRHPIGGGDFEFQIATLDAGSASELEHRLEMGQFGPDTLAPFGPPVALAEAMDLLDVRDFAVFDLPA
ncbi:MAG TPA: hypothetical protein VGI81_14545 [Tepidisphaeraceae bacterium]